MAKLSPHLSRRVGPVRLLGLAVMPAAAALFALAGIGGTAAESGSDAFVAVHVGLPPQELVKGLPADRLVRHSHSSVRFLAFSGRSTSDANHSAGRMSCPPKRRISPGRAVKQEDDKLPPA